MAGIQDKSHVLGRPDELPKGELFLPYGERFEKHFVWVSLIFLPESLMILEMLTRRSFLQAVIAGTASAIGGVARASASKNPSPDYVNISYDEPHWKPLSKGLEFARIEIHRNREIIDVLAVIKTDPKHNRIRVFRS